MRIIRTVFVLLLSGFAAFAVDPQQSLITTRNTNEVRALKTLVPGPDDSRIARVVAAILERSHYNQQPFDDTVSTSFLQKYLDALDPMHIVFLQSDVKEFDKWKTLLDEMTLKLGDTTPAETIFNRFIQRFASQVQHATNLLQTDKFEFTGDERYEPNRKELPRPIDVAEAKKFWRDRVRFEYLQERLNKETPEAIKTNLTRRYTRQLRTLSDFDSEDVFQIYLDSLAHVYDPHTDYMGKPAAENFNISMKLSLFGIGALLQSEDGYCKIKELMEGPAKKGGQVKPNDKIIAVAQGTNSPVDVFDEPLKKVVDMIRGPEGTEVRLTIIPVDAPDPSIRKVVSITRAKINLEDGEAKAKIIEIPDAGGKTKRLGMIDLPSFYAALQDRSANRKSTTTDVAKLLKKLKEENVAGIILDLRRNGGGSLEEAINLTGLFIKKGPVVQVKDPDGRINVDEDTDPAVLYDGPLVVLTSRFSASASEILAGALQDYGRALVVGDSSTHGKGTVQTLLELGPIMRTTNNLGSLKITIRKFYRASGSSTQLKGVVPDIILPSMNNHADLGESSLPNALPWDTVPPAKYEQVNVIPPVLAELRKRSDGRIASDKDYAYVREEIAHYKKKKEEKTYSMNYEVRLKENKETEARAKIRENELRARPEPNYKTYDITLKNVDLPGLPAPTVKTNDLTSIGGKSV
ncbi:MAG TPA: carboxy terminal-processing peptidase, partial [Candidatus Acidoferrum sp.]|nr:carboxy terminal-processing peptidase [Candidatus Acidoferrum sp.]